MTDDRNAPPGTDDVLDEREAADLLRVSEATLADLRRSGKGPPAARVGKAVRYSRAAVLHWIAAGGSAA